VLDTVLVAVSYAVEWESSFFFSSFLISSPFFSDLLLTFSFYLSDLDYTTDFLTDFYSDFLFTLIVLVFFLANNDETVFAFSFF